MFSYPMLLHGVLVVLLGHRISLVDCWILQSTTSNLPSSSLSSSSHRSPLFLAPRRRKINNEKKYKEGTSLLLSSSDDNGNKESSSSDVLDLKDKDVYQRVFYRFSSSSRIPNHDALVVEEIARFEPVVGGGGDAGAQPTTLRPVGRRTLLLRDGKVEDGEIGDVLFRLEVSDGRDRHNGAGLDRNTEATIGMILYLASNPKVLEANVLELSCDLGLGALLGCIGAAKIQQKQQQPPPPKKEEEGEEDSDAAGSDDILTIPKQSSLPEGMKMLFLSDPEEDRLNIAYQNVQASNLPGSKVSLGKLDWSHRKSTTKGKAAKEYHTILGSNLEMTFLEAKELARTVAHRLEPSSSFHTTKENQYISVPTFVFLAPDDAAYRSMEDLRRFFEKGYNMNVNTDYVVLEKIMFEIQTLAKGDPEIMLDDLELEVREYKETVYKTLEATHSPEYNSGMGEYFFPMETGAFENGGNNDLQTDPSGYGPY